MNEDYIETARLLARFQRLAQQMVDRPLDLCAMARNPIEAGRVLAQVEEQAADRDLLALVKSLRARLVPSATPRSGGAASPRPVGDL